MNIIFIFILYSLIFAIVNILIAYLSNNLTSYTLSLISLNTFIFIFSLVALKYFNGKNDTSGIIGASSAFCTNNIYQFLEIKNTFLRIIISIILGILIGIIIFLFPIIT